MNKTDPKDQTVRAWMNAPDYHVSPSTPLDDAFGTMRREDVRHLLVMDGDQLLGVVTDRDLRRPETGGKLWSFQDMYFIGDGLRVSDVMTREVISVSGDDSTAYAARVMVTNKINCLPVLQGQSVVGILTSSDLLAALVHTVDPDGTAGS